MDQNKTSSEGGMNGKPDHRTQEYDSNIAETTAGYQIIRIAENLVSQGAEMPAHTEEITTTHHTSTKAQRRKAV
ncbi:hypothetical protein OUZ56_018569 [Daphnia magna]|uniref:Uncharacterized protein n=1 Tax=Daphnia magna TaxID=35525 RepID=A0ABQ9Z9A2_9CRUS|nr:hypothetical protein OUZ56_018569 [Daphnia magna]